MEFGGTPITKTFFDLKGEFVNGGERIYRVRHEFFLRAMKSNIRILKGI